MIETVLAPIGMLMFAACLMAMLSRRLGLPYIVGLVVTGFLIALLPNSPELPLSRELIFNVLLPPLVFEAALQLDWRRFRNELPLTLTLAFLGVAIATAVVAAGMHYFAGWSVLGAAMFGALIAATDPVSVIAAFREMKAEKRLSMVVESESLLNDGAAAVTFAVLLAIAEGGSHDAATLIGAFAVATGGGVLIGLVISGLALLIAGKTEDHLVEITLTTIAAYSSFLAAEYFHASGVIAAMNAHHSLLQLEDIFEGQLAAGDRDGVARGLDAIGKALAKSGRNTDTRAWALKTVADLELRIGRPERARAANEIAEKLAAKSRGAEIRSMSWRGVADGNWQNNGIRTGVNFGTRLGRTSASWSRAIPRSFSTEAAQPRGSGFIGLPAGGGP